MKFYEKRDNSRLGKLKRWMRPKSHIVPSQFEDSFLTSGNYYRRDPDTLSHMRMLRTWVVANAPKNKLDMRRIQEVHVLNNEIYYQMYKREQQTHSRFLEKSCNIPSCIRVLLEDPDTLLHGKFRAA